MRTQSTSHHCMKAELDLNQILANLNYSVHRNRKHINYSDKKKIPLQIEEAEINSRKQKEKPLER